MANSPPLASLPSVDTLVLYKTPSLTVRVMDFDSDEQIRSISLRERCLVFPLGGSFTFDEYRAENVQIHVGAFEGEELVACVVIVPSTKDGIPYGKVRQFVVETEKQRKGIGSVLLKGAVEYARKSAFHFLLANVIHTALPFYLNNSWVICGESNEEVGHKHFPMELTL